MGDAARVGDAVRPPSADPEFLEFVAARQDILLREAYLVCGDVGLALDVVERSLVSLAAQWDRARHERPDTRVRQLVLRESLSAGRGAPEGVAEAPEASEASDAVVVEELGGHGPWEADEEERRQEVMRALDRLDPIQRAVMALRLLDERTEADTAEVLGVRGARVREALDRAGSEPLLTRDALELASEGLPESDLGEAAWARAEMARRGLRRRTWLGLAGVATAGGALALVLRDGGAERAPVTPSPTVSASPGGNGALAFVGVGGVRVSLAPAPRLEPELPRYPDAASQALPDRLTSGEDRPRAVLDPNGIAGVQDPVRAVFLVHGEGGGYQPVLFLPGGDPAHVLVTAIRLGGSGAAAGDAVPSLGPRTIAGDRHRLVFVQPGAVIVLDARDASTTWIDVPDPTLSIAGWARDGVTVIARGSTESWVVDTDTGAARPASGPVGAEWVDLVDLGSRSLLRSFSGSGELTGTREVRGPGISVTSPPVANTEGWVAVGASIPAEISRAVSRDDGVVVVQGDLRPTPRILAGERTGGDVLPYRAVAWGPRDVVLLESVSVAEESGNRSRRLLAWDVIRERLSLASDLESERDEVGGFTGSWAI